MVNICHPYYNYYSVDNQQYTTRLYSIIASRLRDDQYEIKWHLPNFEKAFDSLNLLVEPLESLDCLYKQRAEALRNQYDYLILHYSGGHDSHNILETFMFNNIHIDEILILDQFDRSFRQRLEEKDFEFLHLNAYEAELSAIPLAKHFIEKYSPTTKLTVVGNSFGIHANYWNNLSNADVINNLKTSGTLGMIGKTPVRTKDLNLYNPSYKNIKENKKVAHIWGRDKTNLRFDDKGYYFRFDDGALTDFIDVYNELTKDNLPQQVEFFYNHPSCAKMISKQAHTILRNVPFHKLVPKLATRAHEDLLATYIYKRKVPTVYSALKMGDLHDDVLTKYLNKKRDPSRDISMVQVCELSLIKSLDADVYKKFELQTEIISKVLKCSPNNVESLMAQNYSTKKFYIKLFD